MTPLIFNTLLSLHCPNFIAVKAKAAILFLYLVGLFIQPSLFPLKQNDAKVMSCCVNKDKGTPHRGCGKDRGCCDSGTCNPFFTQCPNCAANAVVHTPFYTHVLAAAYVAAPRFGLLHQNLHSHYLADISQPPEIV